MTDFDDYQYDKSPGWFRGANAELWSRILGVVKQGVVQAAKAAVRTRFANTAPPDAMPAIVADRDLVALPGASQSVLRSMALGAWNTWKKAGTKAGMISAFADAGMTCGVAESTDSPVLAWHEIDVTISPPFPWPGNAPGDVPEAYRNLIVALVKKWKPTHATARRVQVNCYAETWAQRQARRGTWNAPPPEPWTGKLLRLAENLR